VARLLIFARRSLVTRPVPSGQPALLLEGSWPDTASPWHQSLDEAIDGRFDGIDQTAADWAEQIAADSPTGDGLSIGYLNALPLRYYLVKLLRVAAFFTNVAEGGERKRWLAQSTGWLGQSAAVPQGTHVDLTISAEQDGDYARVISDLCRAAGARYRADRVASRPTPRNRFPANPLWRRIVGRCCGGRSPKTDRSCPRPRIVLCGNPRLLGPVCRELLDRHARVWWLVDRFAVKLWLRWRAAGVGQLVCDSSEGRENRLPKPRLRAELAQRLSLGGVDLAVPIERWLNDRAATHGPCQTRLIERIDHHFHGVRPDAVVLDEDATPLARAAVALGRRHEARSFVVQHGAPYCRFGFSPLAADRFLAWGTSSKRRLVAWGVPSEQIRVVGMPRSALPPVVSRPLDATRPPRVLLLATAPPRDGRPDSVALQLSGRKYAEMLRVVFASMAAVEGAELIVKLHPRASDDPVIRTLQAEFPALRCRVVRRGRFERWLDRVDCVLSCGSSAGVEAATTGVPVTQLAPASATGFLPDGQWGMAGTASNRRELDRLLAAALTADRKPGPDPQVFAALGRNAAARIAQEVLTFPYPEITPQPFSSRRHGGLTPNAAAGEAAVPAAAKRRSRNAPHGVVAPRSTR